MGEEYQNKSYIFNSEKDPSTFRSRTVLKTQDSINSKLLKSNPSKNRNKLNASAIGSYIKISDNDNTYNSSSQLPAVKKYASAMSHYQNQSRNIRQQTVRQSYNKNVYSSLANNSVHNLSGQLPKQQVDTSQVFVILPQSEMLKTDKTKIIKPDKERLSRLTIPKRLYRDSSMESEASVDGKLPTELKTCTIEDKIFDPVNVRFMLQLRNSIDSSMANSAKRESFEGPPSFYNQDITKYRQKFQSSIDQRRAYKKQVEKIFKSVEGGVDRQETQISQTKPHTQFKSNTNNQPTKRLPSRQSNTTFTNVDFDYKGNAHDIIHMLRRRDSGSPNVCQLKFELGLRRYLASKLKQTRPQWNYLGIVKSKIKPHQEQELPDSEKYQDKFREANMNQFRELFKSKVDLKGLLWETHLRNYQTQTQQNKKYKGRYSQIE